MATLHLVNRSPLESRSLEQCLARAEQGDAVLLIEDGVYAAVRNAAAEPMIRAAAGRVQFHALRPDLEARGFGDGDAIDLIGLVDYPGFVRLALAHPLIQSWF